MVRTLAVTGTIASLIVSLIVAQPALARGDDRPITRREPGVVDVAKTPMTDLNLTRTEIPALLVEAQTRPYSTQGLETCAAIVAAVEEYDTVLGPDVDLPQAERSRLSTGRVAQWAVGRLIPFRSLIREVSGANSQEREIRSAVQAGMARRGFLKGLGAARTCPYPASPATETIVTRYSASQRQDEDTNLPDPRADEPKSAPSASPPSRPPVIFTSQPVVQPAASPPSSRWPDPSGRYGTGKSPPGFQRNDRTARDGRTGRMIDAWIRNPL
jgi:hypothetical protein